MKQLAKRWINSALRMFGVQLVAAADDERQALVTFLHKQGIGNVIDVGANEGQFAQQLLDKGYAGGIYCCEPLEEAHKRLSERFDGHNRVHVVRRTAIAATSGTITINVSGNSVSSSARPMLDAHSEAAPRSAYVDSEEVPLTTLDELFQDKAAMFDQGVLLKIDTQGFEAEVLAGAATTLPLCKAVLIEMSSTPLYEGQVLWDELHHRLTNAGFELWNLLPDFRDPASGRLLQFDGLYLRH